MPEPRWRREGDEPDYRFSLANERLRWRGNEIAMRHARRLPGTTVIPLLAASLIAVAAIVAFLLFRS